MRLRVLGPVGRKILDDSLEYIVHGTWNRRGSGEYH